MMSLSQWEPPVAEDWGGQWQPDTLLSKWHVYPKGDLFVHTFNNCECQPEFNVCLRPCDGLVAFSYMHRPFDGRK
jgi:hypothetical protein